MMAIKRLYLIAFGSIILWAQGCYYDNEEYLYPNSFGDLTTVTYLDQIQPIIAAKCAVSGCHVSGTGLAPLTNYAETSAVAVDGKLKTKVVIEQSMPPSGPLPTLERQQIQRWIETGNP